MTDHLLEKQAKALYHAVTELVRKYQFRDRNEICCHGISVSQCYTMSTLGESGVLSMHELADKMHLTVSTMTRVIDQLVEKGLAKRKTSPEDRRVCCVQLTKEGESLLKTIEGELVDVEKQILEKIKPTERETMIRAIEDLSRAMEEWRMKSRVGAYCNTPLQISRGIMTK
ncbi:MAG: MarR family transcriptional regulator [Candidatus Tectomicrobia bacterium]|nr:MarR family transcriptional regulator [Candidatus Tectomicrobia bacterium]